MSSLIARVEADPAIRLLPDRVAIDLISSAKIGTPGPNRCVGVYALNRATGRVETIAARAVVLATGGASKVYLYTTNPDTSTGDGIAMAWRAGCRVANMEFVQFHPTCLFHPHAKSILISEAVRGEGGILRLPDGRRFMPDHDPRAELAPRDVVARAIDAEMKRGGYDCVYLDISHKDPAEILNDFPNIAARLREFGIDMTKDRIPVVPAAHYTCGGIVTDLGAATDLPGLYAVGECASTGLHGANRLASNSLLECVVFASAAHTDRPWPRTPRRCRQPAGDESRVTDPDELVVVSHNWDELRRLGLCRIAAPTSASRHRCGCCRRRSEFTQLSRHERPHRAAQPVAGSRTDLSAEQRPESRGLHYNRDYPPPFPTTKPRTPSQRDWR